MTDRMNDLVNIVETRKERVLKELCKEQLEGSFQPFKLLAEVPNIEIKMWESHNNTRVYRTADLRDRFQFLLTLSTVMRSDSVYKANLCDMCDFTFLQRREKDPYHILILRDRDGKGSKVKTKFAKVMRHRLAQLCPIGALGLWLLARFDIAEEYKSFDFTSNGSWFNVKILSSTQIKKRIGVSGSGIYICYITIFFLYINYFLIFII